MKEKMKMAMQKAVAEKVFYHCLWIISVILILGGIGELFNSVETRNPRWILFVVGGILVYMLIWTLYRDHMLDPNYPAHVNFPWGSFSEDLLEIFPDAYLMQLGTTSEYARCVYFDNRVLAITLYRGKNGYELHVVDDGLLVYSRRVKL